MTPSTRPRNTEGANFASGFNLPRLTSLRAFAALAVFAYHIEHDTTWGLLSSVSRLGYAGVGFFFILSGLVLTWATKPGIGSTTFLVKRFARIYPIYLLALMAAIFVPETAAPFNWPALAAGATLTQAWFVDWSIVFGLNAVGWSLSCEFFFYALTPLALRRLHGLPTRLAAPILGTWFGLMAIVGTVMGFVSNGTDVYAYTNPLIRSGEYALGILAGLLATRRQLPKIPISAGVLLVLMAALFLRQSILPQTVVSLTMSAPFLIVILAAARADILDKPGLLRWKVLEHCGHVSYAFYLVHELVIFNVAAAVPDAFTATRTGQVLTMGGMLVLSYGLAVLLHKFVEKPAQRAILHAYRTRFLGS